MAAQDMPPPGGFASINVERTFPKPLMRQGIFLATLLFLTVNGPLYIYEWKKRLRALKIEEMEHYIAYAPFLLAEQDRKFLKVLKRNKIDEEYVMKDVPGWTFDGFFGEKIYKTVPEDKIVSPYIGEFVLGRPKNEWMLKSVIPDWYK